jgi:hypothetical protein
MPISMMIEYGSTASGRTSVGAACTGWALPATLRAAASMPAVNDRNNLRLKVWAPIRLLYKVEWLNDLDRLPPH